MAKLFVADPRLANDPSLGLPRFALVVSAAATGGWHMAALVREAANPEFYLRSIAVPWAFMIARPAPSTRQNDAPVRPADLSPARTSPARKLVVNWGWQRVDPATEQLQFYVRRVGPLWVSPKRPLKLRLRLKEQQPPQRRFVTSVSSKPIDWRQRPAEVLVTDESSSPAAS